MSSQWQYMSTFVNAQASACCAILSTDHWAADVHDQVRLLVDDSLSGGLSEIREARRIEAFVDIALQNVGKHLLLVIPNKGCALKLAEVLGLDAALLRTLADDCRPDLAIGDNLAPAYKVMMDDSLHVHLEAHETIPQAIFSLKNNINVFAKYKELVTRFVVARKNAKDGVLVHIAYAYAEGARGPLEYDPVFMALRQHWGFLDEGAAWNVKAAIFDLMGEKEFSAMRLAWNGLNDPKLQPLKDLDKSRAELFSDALRNSEFENDL